MVDSGFVQGTTLAITPMGFANVRMPLAESIRRKDTERQEWFPVTITKAGTLKLIEYHGSAHISALTGADGLIHVNVGIAEVEKGTIVEVRLI